MSTATAPAKARRNGQAPRRPEKKFGPFQNGLGVAIWLNRVDTDDGPRYFRSITLAPRRYWDEKTQQWKDASSYRSIDLATLELALGAARLYIAATPLPGQPVQDEEELHGGDGELAEGEVRE